MGIADVLLSSRRALLPYAPLAHTDAEVRQWVSEALVPSGGVKVACLGGTVIGFLATTRESNVSWVNQLYIAPNHTGQGIGSRLLSLALASLALPIRLYTSKPILVHVCSTSAMGSRQLPSVTAAPMTSGAPMFCMNLLLQSSLGPNPSVKGTSCGKPQAAPYVERYRAP